MYSGPSAAPWRPWSLKYCNLLHVPGKSRNFPAEVSLPLLALAVLHLAQHGPERLQAPDDVPHEIGEATHRFRQLHEGVGALASTFAPGLFDPGLASPPRTPWQRAAGRGILWPA